VNAIRPATAADVAELARVHVACWHESYDGLVPPALLAAFTVERGRTVWARLIGEPAAYHAVSVYVAHCGDRLAGFGSCCAQRSADLGVRGYAGEISSIYLLREFQRRGLGAAVMQTLADDLLGRSFAAVSLWVLRDNSRARRFYERCGGRVIGERTDVRENTELPEVAYGWQSLAALRDVAGSLQNASSA
jgi:ribosomal protein S18 acetylase RimI-like enzyme